jgi:L-cysteine desulfidase
MLNIAKMLDQEVQPALGCTEPGAVALAVARACEELDTSQELLDISLEISDSIYKNGMAVGVPGVRGAQGNAVAAALAALCGKSDYGLEVLKNASSEDVSRAIQWVREGKVHIAHLPERSGVYVQATVTTTHDTAACVIEGTHSNITSVTKNGSLVLHKESRVEKDDSPPVSKWIRHASYQDLYDAANQITSADRAYLLEGVTMNRAIAEFGLQDTQLLSSNYGRCLQASMKNSGCSADLGYRIRCYCYAAAEARMAGAQLPVMSSAGSGNSGITSILPVALVGEALGSDSEDIARAILVSHLTTSYVKAKVGRLTAVCGCAVASGAGAAAGIVLLLGGSMDESARAIRTVLANTAGMFCDGAKESCALKVGTAAHEAYLAAKFAVCGKGIDKAQGVADHSVEQTIENVARISREGMKDVDRVMIEIMDERQSNESQPEAGKHRQRRSSNKRAI